ncbi:MAG: hypothetical protein IJT59_01895, partial [Desulfovibrionaceae bacterium]|nr:hypothetical protein [Desulfovibrionaceae bacterium]
MAVPLYDYSNYSPPKVDSDMLDRFIENEGYLRERTDIRKFIYTNQVGRPVKFPNKDGFWVHEKSVVLHKKYDSIVYAIKDWAQNIKIIKADLFFDKGRLDVKYNSV